MESIPFYFFIGSGRWFYSGRNYLLLCLQLNAFELDGPVLVNIMTDPNALAMPPKIEFGQMVGFAQSMYKLLINGRSQEVIDTINSNFKHIREVF